MDMGIGLAIAFSISLLIYGFARFNTWTKEEEKTEPFENPPRHFTTWWRYSFHGVIYSSALILLYLLCALFPEIILSLDKLLPIKSETLQDLNNFKIDLSKTKNITEMQQAAIMGMLLFVPVYGILNRYDKRWRHWVHEQAFIPHHAKALIKEFKNNLKTFEPIIPDMKSQLEDDTNFEDTLTQDTCNYYQSLINDPREFIKSPATSETLSKDEVARIWAKVNYLKIKLGENILNTSNAEKCLKKCKNQIKGLDVDYRYFSKLVKIFFSLDPFDPDKKDAHKFISKQIQDTADKTLSKFYLISCCAALRLTKSENTQKELFKSLGLNPTLPAPPGVVPFTIVARGLGIILILGIVGTFWFEQIAGSKAITLEFISNEKLIELVLIEQDSINVLLWPFYILVLHAFAVIFGLASMRVSYRWYHNVLKIDATEDQETITAAVIAIVSTFIVCSAILYGLILIYTEDAPRLFSLKIACLWSLVPLSSAFFSVLYLRRNLYLETESSPHKRAQRAMTQGLTTGFMGFVCIYVFLRFADEITGPVQFPIYFKIYVTGITTAVGLILGYFLPTSYERFLRSESYIQREAIRKKATSERLPAWVG